MIVDLEMRLWARTDDLGDQLSAAVRRSNASRWLQPDPSPETLETALGAVDAGVIVGFQSELLRGAVPESYLRPVVERSNGRLFLARAVDPMARDAASMVENARRDGASAIWVDPCLQGFHPSDTRAMRVFDRAEVEQLPVFVGWSGPLPAAARLEFGRPYLLDEVARAFPRLSLVIGGLGSPFASETIALLGKHDRVFTHLAGVVARPWELLHTLQACRDAGVDRKLLFASGYPFDMPARAIEAIYAVNSWVQSTPLPHISRSVLREIVERDAISLLGLGVPPVPGSRETQRTLASDARLRLTGESG
jgi:predicted TIM-barrel fold metal-dependent hydrolase